MHRYFASLVILSLAASLADAAFVVKRVIPGGVALPSVRGSAESIHGSDMDGDPSSSEAFTTWRDAELQVHGGIIHLATGVTEELNVQPYDLGSLGDPTSWGAGARGPEYVDVDGDGLLDVLVMVGGWADPYGPLKTIIIGCSGAAGASEPTGDAIAPSDAFPNPTESNTTIRFANPTSGSVGLSVYDVAGRLVRKLATERMDAGDRVLPWDGCDDSGRDVPSGVYLYTIETAGAAVTGRLVVTR